MHAVIDQLDIRQLSATGRPQLTGGEVIMMTQDGVGLYAGDERLAGEWESGTCYLSNLAIIWTSSSSGSHAGLSLDLSRIASIAQTSAFLATSHAKIVCVFKRGRDSTGASATPLEAATKQLEWTCSICQHCNHAHVAVGQQVKCDQCGVPTATSSLKFPCSICTFQQSLPVDGRCVMCLSDVFPSSVAVSTASAPAWSGDVLCTIKYSFRAGGQRQFMERLEAAIQSKSWLSTASTSTAATATTGGQDEVMTPRSGLSGLMRDVSETQRRQDETVSLAFKDLDALMERAQSMVQIAQSISSKLLLQQQQQQQQQESGGSDGDAESTVFHQMLMDLGIDDPVTRDNAGDGYHIQLSRQLADFALPLLKQRGGMISLTDIYCLYNRARGGVSLISPDDLYKACKLLDMLPVPVVRMRSFDSGLRVLQTADFSEERVVDRILVHVKSCGFLTAASLSELERVSVLVAGEQLEMAERRGALCRDECVHGLQFYPNLFLL
eukprot:Partr_v1_DN26590_c0_g1_i1_m3576 putative vacuolar protein sorting